MRDLLDELDYYCGLYLSHGGVPPDVTRLVARGNVSEKPLAFFRAHYGIPDDVVIEFDSGDVGAAGIIRTIKHSKHYIISLASSHEGWVSAEDAIVAHELAHAYMDVKKLELPVTAENERLTDVCVILLGGGLVANFVSFEDSYGSDKPGFIRVSTGRLGYLVPDERAYVLAKFLLMGGVTRVPEVGQFGLRQSDLAPLKKVWGAANQRFVSAKQKPIKRDGLVWCPRCSSEMVVKKTQFSCVTCGLVGTLGFWAGWRPSVL